MADKSTRDWQQPMLLYCYPHLETWCLIKCARYLAGWIKLVGGMDAGCGMATPALKTRIIA